MNESHTNTLRGSRAYETPVPRIPVTEVGDLERLERAGTPVIVTGLQQGWSAPERWTLDHLRETVGSRRVRVEFYPTGSFFDPEINVEMRFSAYLDLITATEPEQCYVSQVPLTEVFPELVPDIEVPELLHPAPGLGAAFFLGRDTVTGLHYHSANQALQCMVAGRKDVTLFPPEDRRLLGYEPWYSYRFNFSRIAFDRELRHERAHPWRCEVRAGEALFIPLYWGHLVRSPGYSTAVTFFWDPLVTGWSHPRLKLLSMAGNLTRDLVTVPARGLLERTVGLPG
ncbi:cupin-like domain-containing protein [Actinomadura welshii]|uniref:cupin-like domain-containing protein n=1 Tax=Actinomadura welshii TaxID=3103817 RepID=UPI0003AD09E1|nr:cupin-like domain-containing protein [Actinomadura madurae]